MDNIASKQIEESVEQFKAMCALELNDIWKIADKNNLIVALDMYVAKKCEYGDAVERLSEAEKTLYLCISFENEINNGGFEQYYYSPSGDYCYEVPAALKTIGAIKTAKLANRANKLFTRKLPSNQEKREEFLDEYLTDKLDLKFEKLDDKFYDSEEDLSALNYAYVMKHKAEFS